MAVTSPADFNLFDPAVMECPFPFYEALRREAPVYEVPGFGMYLVSRFDDIVEALRAPEVFSSDLARAATGSLVGMFSPPPSEEIDEILAKGFPPTNTLLTNDPRFMLAKPSIAESRPNPIRATDPARRPARMAIAPSAPIQAHQRQR